MSIKTQLMRSALCSTAVILLISPSLPAKADENFGDHSVRGKYVLAFDGAFSSAPPPFTGEVLQFRAALVGVLTLDGAGRANGEMSLVFHHPAVPFPIRSRKALLGSYAVAANGHVVIELGEFELGDDGLPAGPRHNSVVYECYIVERQILAQCIGNSLVTFQQGPEPRMLPMTIAGTLQRQN